LIRRGQTLDEAACTLVRRLGRFPGQIEQDVDAGVEDSDVLPTFLRNDPEIHTMLRPVKEIGRPPWETGPDSQRAQPRGDGGPAHWDSGPVAGELELMPSRPPIGGHSVDDGAGGEERSRDWSKLVGQARRHQVTLGALSLIIASLIWKGAFLSHFYFRQDDFEIIDQALKSGLTWKLLTTFHSGHFFPGVYLISWVLSRLALYSWAAGAGVELVLIAGSSLAAWQLLRTLLGNRPALLIPLALYVLSPLPFQAYSWWIAGVEAIPLQIAVFMSLGAHVRYVWTGRLRHAILAAVWLVFGLFFFEKSAVIPLLLFAVTACFLAPRRSLLSAIWAAAVRFWRAWALYLVVLATYLIVFVTSLSGSGQQPPQSTPVQKVVVFGWGLLFHSFVPGILGGPWAWYIPAGAAGGNAAAPSAASWVALVVVVGFVVASILTRRRAWRGWAILAIWVLIDDILPVVIGRLDLFPGYAAVLATQTRYVDDAAAVLAVVVALIFWPLAGPPAAQHQGAAPLREMFASTEWRRAALALIIVVAIGSAWTVSQFMTRTADPSRPYIAEARAALAQQPGGTVILDRQVPSSVMIGAFGSQADTSVVLGPLSGPGRHIDWISQPTGNIGGLKMFGPDGRLYAAAIQGVTGQSPSVFADCLSPHRDRLVVRLPLRLDLAPYVRVLRIGYLANVAATGATVTVTYAGSVGKLTVAPKANNAYLPVTGSSPRVELQATLPAGVFCFEKAVAGYFIPLPGTGVPAPVSRSAS
jgi:hypothetical protein